MSHELLRVLIDEFGRCNSERRKLLAKVRSYLRLRWNSFLPLVFCGTLCSCGGFKDYAPDPISQADITREFESNRQSLASIEEFVAEAGYQNGWPPSTWGLDELTIAGAYFSPSIQLSRRLKELTDAIGDSILNESGISLSIASEYHSREVVGDEPWGVGFVVGLPFVTKEKKKTLSDKSLLYKESALYDLSAAAWKLHSNLRDYLLSINFVDQQLELANQKLRLLMEVGELTQKRVDNGFDSSIDLTKRLLAIKDFEEHVLELESSGVELVSKLAGEVGLPFDAFATSGIFSDLLNKEVSLLHRDAYRTIALRHRSDLQKTLVEFGISDAELKLSLIAQYPELTFSPGYFWDQGDSVWNFALGLIMPKNSDVKILEKEASRAVQRARVKEIQTNILSDIDTEYSSILFKQSVLSLHQEKISQAFDLMDRKVAEFERGHTNRVELYEARIQLLDYSARMLEDQFSLMQSIAALEDICESPAFFDSDISIGSINTKEDL